MFPNSPKISMASNPAPAVKSRFPCRLFIRGKCTYGEECRNLHAFVDCKYGPNCTAKDKCCFMHPGDPKPEIHPPPSRHSPEERKSNDKRSHHGVPQKHRDPDFVHLGSAKIHGFDSNVKTICVLAFGVSEQELHEAGASLSAEMASFRIQLEGLLAQLTDCEKMLASVMEQSTRLKPTAVAEHAAVGGDESDDVKPGTLKPGSE